MAGGGAGQAAWLEDREGNSATLCQEVTKLTTALQEYQDMVQVRVDGDDLKGLYIKKKTKKTKTKSSPRNVN